MRSSFWKITTNKSIKKSWKSKKISNKNRLKLDQTQALNKKFKDNRNREKKWKQVHKLPSMIGLNTKKSKLTNSSTWDSLKKFLKTKMTLKLMISVFKIKNPNQPTVQAKALMETMMIFLEMKDRLLLSRKKKFLQNLKANSIHPKEQL
jgi:hypothetical protein